MIEKVLYFVGITAVGVIGYFINRTLNHIEAGQKEHTKSLRVNSDRVVRLEERQTFLEKQISGIEHKIDSATVASSSLQERFNENLTQMQAEVGALKRIQEEQGQNFGKVFMIVQKLYAQLIQTKKS